MNAQPTFLTRRITHPLIALAAACLLLAGCVKTRSISNPSSTDSYRHGGRSHSDPAFEYRGELNEFDVLAVDRDKAVSEDEIKHALEQARPVKLKPGGSILVVQSGAAFPDGPMLAALRKHFVVTPFSGVPPRRLAESDPALSYSRSLRLAAARAGSETIACYWGTLESARRKLETKTISWVPFAGWLIPDEKQHVRIRLKVALIDVGTGNWRVLCPEPFEDRAISTSFTRGSSDQRQVEALKAKAYAAAVRELVGNGGPEVGLAR